MRVAIAGAGAVGRSIAAELIADDHQVMLIERQENQYEPHTVEQAEWVLADACELSVGDLVRLLTLRQGQANLVELTLPEDTPLAGRPVSAVHLPKDAALVVILRGGRVIVPQPDDPLEAGDELLFVASANVEDEIRRALGY
jgi:Trk K+ transport system NAD-binding subunit